MRISTDKDAWSTGQLRAEVKITRVCRLGRSDALYRKLGQKKTLADARRMIRWTTCRQHADNNELAECRVEEAVWPSLYKNKTLRCVACKSQSEVAWADLLE